MRPTTAILLLLLSAAACNDPSPKSIREKTEERLKSAMQSKLYKDINNDSSHTKYQVLDVKFFEGKEYYNCEFNVHLKHDAFDTTGVMTADISKDMTIVKRKL